MITPLDIENKKFSKQMMSGYSVEEVDDFLDEITASYEKMYRENTEKDEKVERLEEQIVHYKKIEETLNNTLILAQSTADEIKNTAKQQAEQTIKNAEFEAKESLKNIEQQIMLKQRELEDVQKQFEVYKAKMESLLISQLELLKEVNKQDE
jgi:cell division initiation protein